MAYPRQLRLDKDTEERLGSYIETELLNHYQERSAWQDRLHQWQRDYWAEPIKKRATAPFVGASTLVIPLTAIAVEAVHARTMTTLFAMNQLISTTALSGAFSDIAKPVEKHLNHEMLNEMKARRQLDSILLELEKFGTGIGKVGYERIVKTAVRSLPDGSEVEFPVVIRDGACLDPVSIGRFIMPHSITDPQKGPWCGEEHAETPYTVKCLEESGLFKKGTFDKLKAWITERNRSTTGVERRFQQDQEKLEQRESQWPNLIDWVELWLGFDVDQSGYEKEIVVHWHRGARLIMAAFYNFHDDLHRPYRYGNWFPVEHRWTGIGICKQNDQFQREITTQHRQRLDNATLANMRMIKVSKLSGYGPNEPIFPGKMWFVDDMDHVDTFQLGEIYNSAYNNEQATLIYSEKRTGVNDTILGSPASGTPGTATGDLARIQESNKKFDYGYQNEKGLVRELAVDTACVIQQFGPRRIEYYDVVEGGNLVKAFYDMPVELIRHGLLIDIAAAGQQQNKVLDRQNWISVAQLLQQYYLGMLQLAQFSGDQSLLQLITQKGLVAATEAMKQILESFDVRNVDRIILSEFLTPGAGNATNAGGLGQQAALGGGNGRPALPGQTQGMDNFSQIIQALGAGGGQGVRGF